MFIKLYEEFEDTKGVIIIRRSKKERQLSHLHVGNVLPHPTFLALNVRKA
jgi:hypothetical protein